QAPHAFNAIGVNVSAYPFVLTVDDVFMTLTIHEILVCAMLVRIELVDVRIHNASEECLHRVLGGATAIHFQANLAPALSYAYNHCLAISPFAFTDTLLPTANPGFISLKNSGKHCGLSILHRRPDAMAEIPSGLVGHTECPLHLVGADSLASLDHDQDSGEPLTQGKFGVVEDRARH